MWKQLLVELVKLILPVVVERIPEWLDSLLAKKEIQPCGYIPGGLMYALCEAKYKEVGDDHAEIYIADNDCKVYRKEDVVNSRGLTEVSKIKYVPETMDCDDFARKLYGRFAGLIWTTKHALNWFIDDTDTLWFIEPQTKQISQTLEDWQGWDIRFFITG